MVTKVKSGVIGDNTVGITQLNVSDGSNGQALTTNGSGTLSFSTVATDGITSSGSNTIIQSPDNTNVLHVNNSASVGIGLSSPTTYYSAGVHIKGSASAAIKMTNGDTGDTNDDGVDLALDDSEEFRILNRENAGVSLWTNATRRLTINGSGKVGIGTDSPSADLTLTSRAYNDSGAGGASGIRFTDGGDGTADAILQSIRVGNDGAHMLMGANCYVGTGGGVVQFDSTENSNYVDCNAYAGAVIFGTSAAGSNPSERMRITSTGEVGIGTTSPAGKFQVEGSHSGQIGYFNQTGTGGGNHGVYIDSASTSGWTFLVRNGSSTARFGLTGSEFRWFNGVTVQAGTSTSDKGSGIRNWAASGYIALSGDLTGYSAGTYSTLKANGPYIYFDIGGSYSAYMARNGSINANSDRTLKQNITTLSSGQLAKVCSLRGVNFEWIDERETGTQVGLIAQEVQEEYPELVGNGGITDGTLAVNYAGLVSPLIEAIKELKTELDAAKARITTLEG